MTIRCKFSPLGQPVSPHYSAGTILYEKAASNGGVIQDQLLIYSGVYELICCSGGGGTWCGWGCNAGSAGSFFKGVVYFDHNQSLYIQVGGGSDVSSYDGYPTFIDGYIFCPGGKSANSTCPGNSAAPTLYERLHVISTEICAGGVCNGESLFSGLYYGAPLNPGYLKITYLRLLP